MGFPSMDCCDDITEVCCSTLWGHGTHLLSVAGEPLLDCLPSGGGCCGEPLTMFVSLGRPSVYQFDYLAVWLDGIQLTAGSFGPRGEQLIRSITRANWRIRLIEGNYPAVMESPDGQSLVVPSIELLHAVNEHAYSHGELMFRAIVKALEGRYLAPRGCSSAAVTSFSPVPGESGAAGWEIGITLDVDWMAS